MDFMNPHHAAAINEDRPTRRTEMNTFMSIAAAVTLMVFGISGIENGAKKVQVEKPGQTYLVAVDAIDMVAQSGKGCAVTLDNGRTIYTTKHWDSLVEMLTDDKEETFIILYGRNLTKK